MAILRNQAEKGKEVLKRMRLQGDKYALLLFSLICGTSGGFLKALLERAEEAERKEKEALQKVEYLTAELKMNQATGILLAIILSVCSSGFS